MMMIRATDAFPSLNGTTPKPVHEHERYVVRLQSAYRGLKARAHYGLVATYDAYEKSPDCGRAPELETSKRCRSPLFRNPTITITSDVSSTYDPGSPIMQVAGHGTITKARGAPDVVLKQSSSQELSVFESVQGTPVESLLPKYLGFDSRGELFSIRMANLTAGMSRPCVMDIKMGKRTFLESETTNTKRRQDLAKKIIDLDPHELTNEELSEGVTKLRYMQFRERRSSSASIGFRIEGIRALGFSYPDSKNIRSETQIVKALNFFLQSRADLKQAFLSRLKQIRDTLSGSEWFMTHELVGSSILFVYDDVIGDNAAAAATASAHMIDFAKTEPLPQGVHLTHKEEWSPGNHEEGYLEGLDNLVSLWEGLEANA